MKTKPKSEEHKQNNKKIPEREGKLDLVGFVRLIMRSSSELLDNLLVPLYHSLIPQVVAADVLGLSQIKFPSIY